jgi:hypothetical protein
MTVARSPDKLRNYLAKEHDISPGIIEQYLTIYQGNAKEPADVAKALVSPVKDGLLVDVILSGVGAYPTFQWSITCPFPLTDPTICEMTIGAVYKALENLTLTPGRPIGTKETSAKPLLVVVSTSGCGRKRGVPLSVYLPYHYFLSSPLADKKNMEALIFADQGVHVRDFVIIRPLVLTDGPTKGDDGLRVGWEWGIEREEGDIREPGPEIGYFVSRRDVGKWTFDKVIAQGGWEGKCVYLTY